MSMTRSEGASSAPYAQDLRLPSFLIVGAMRSGTTSMARYLLDHPDVFMSSPKEVHFFDEHYSEGVDWYAKHFAAAAPGQAPGEATPAYLPLPDAVERMAATVPDARIIAILRDPVVRSYSGYWRQRSKGRETLEFRQAIQREAERMALPMGYLFAYVGCGRYEEQLRHLSRFYQRESILVIIFEEMVKAPVDAFKEVCRFIGVRDDIVPRVVGEPRNAYVSAKKRKLERWAKVPLATKLIRRMTPPSSYPPMDQDVRERLADIFAEPNAALAAWLGRDLSLWSAPGACAR